jgi:hypothetical protein
MVIFQFSAFATDGAGTITCFGDGALTMFGDMRLRILVYSYSINPQTQHPDATIPSPTAFTDENILNHCVMSVSPEPPLTSKRTP